MGNNLMESEKIQKESSTRKRSIIPVKKKVKVP